MWVVGVTIGGRGQAQEVQEASVLGGLADWRSRTPELWQWRQGDFSVEVTRASERSASLRRSCQAAIANGGGVETPVTHLIVTDCRMAPLR